MTNASSPVTLEHVLQKGRHQSGLLLSFLPADKLSSLTGLPVEIVTFLSSARENVKNRFALQMAERLGLTSHQMNMALEKMPLHLDSLKRAALAVGLTLALAPRSGIFIKKECDQLIVRFGKEAVAFALENRHLALNAPLIPHIEATVAAVEASGRRALIDILSSARHEAAPLVAAAFNLDVQNLTSETYTGGSYLMLALAALTLAKSDALPAEEVV